MSQEHAWPAAWRRGAEAPAQEGRSRRRGGGETVDAALVLSGLPQAFDAWVFAALAIGVFPRLFFSALPLAAGVAAGAGVWMLAYLVAAATAAILGRRPRDASGRGRRAIARLLFAGATVAVAAVPPASSHAWALAMLLALRLCQGLALGGLAHRVPAGDDARRRMLRSRLAAAAIGLVAAALILAVFALGLPQGDLLAWGWRYPFVIALALNMAAFMGDLQRGQAGGHHPADKRPKLRLVAVGGVRVDRRT